MSITQQQLNFAYLLWSDAFEALAPNDSAHVNFWSATAGYDEPDRHYHDKSHVYAVLSEIHSRCDGLTPKEKGIACLAAFYHDAVYIPGALDNEERSADFAKNQLSNTRIDRAAIDRTCKIILMTKYPHDTDDPIGNLVVDADLAELGASWPTFLRNDAAIRREHARFSDKVYYPARSKFLTSLLEREYIYRTEEGRRNESTARQNMTQLLTMYSDWLPTILNP
jgi:predicted metal-dependent HD superfamily phosphohydrolase